MNFYEIILSDYFSRFQIISEKFDCEWKSQELIREEQIDILSKISQDLRLKIFDLYIQEIQIRKEEIKFLLFELKKKVIITYKELNAFESRFAQLEIDTIKNNVKFIEEKIQSLLFKLEKITDNAKVDSELLEIQYDLRVLYKLYGSSIELNSWQSPSHESSISYLECGAMQSKYTVPYTHDYKRWSLGANTKDWESEFCKTFIDQASITNTVSISFLTSSGMTAISLSLLYLLSESKQVRNIYIDGESYFEIGELLEKFEPNIHILRINNVSEINFENDDIIIFEPINNSKYREFSIFYSNLDKILKRKKKPYLIIDRTILGNLFQPYLRFSSSSKKIIIVESLLKNYQYGLETGQGGVLSIVTRTNERKNLYEKITHLRSINGFLPSDVHFASYLPLNREFTEWRLIKQSFNAYILSILLKNELNNKWKVYYPNLTKENRWGGGIISIEDIREDDQEYYDKIVKESVRILRQKKIPVNVGLGFGFNTMRISSCIHDFGKPKHSFYLRISTGTDTLLDLIIIGELLVNVLNNFSD